MTNLLTVLPEFDVRPHAHILPSLEKALISTADLLTLDALDVAKRAQVPPGEVKKLNEALLGGLHATITSKSDVNKHEVEDGAVEGFDNGVASAHPSHAISTLDETLDTALNGGIPPGYLTEIVGER